MRAFQKIVDQVANALGFQEKGSRSVSTSTNGDKEMETLLKMVSTVTGNVAVCLGEVSSMPLSSECDPSWLAKTNGTVKEIASRLQWERWLLSMGDYQGWAEVKALCSRVPLKRELKPLPRASLNHNLPAEGPTDREPCSRKSPAEPELKNLRPAECAIAAERGTKRRASEDVGASSVWTKLARHADAGDKRRANSRRLADIDLGYGSNTSRGSPFSLDDVLTQKAFAKLDQRDVSPDPREGRKRLETHASISIRGKGRSTREEEATEDIPADRWMPVRTHEDFAVASGDRRRTAYDGMGRSDGRGPRPHAPHDRYGRDRMGVGASSSLRSVRHPSYDARDKWW